MMTELTLNEYIDDKQKIIGDAIQAYYAKQQHIPEPLKESMLYSLNAGGKRLRPVLLLASYETYHEAPVEPALSSAIALEMIHTYSLIHDDLPAMDNDNYRRGKLTNHKVYNEATAILAGDSLLTCSFELIASDPHLKDNQKVNIIQLLSRASGPEGMVGGQILDIAAENHGVTLTELEEIHTLKTGKLLHFAIETGAYLGGASEEQRAALHTFSHFLGLIFQVQDDILDIVGDEEKLGKQTGSDEDKNKSTYPKLLGLDGARQKKNEYVQKAKQALKEANADKGYLMALTDHFSQRDH